MENIIDYMSSLFIRFDYKIISSKDGLIFLCHNKHHDYWILYTTESLDYDCQLNILEKANEFFLQNKEAEKNTTLLIILKVSTVNENILNKTIEMENDPFYFKKYVLLYTEKGWKSYNKLHIDNIEEFLLKKETFESLKTEAVSGEIGPYHLVYSIAHKLPFLMLNVMPTNSSVFSNKYVPSNKAYDDMYKWLKKVNLDDMENNIEQFINNELEYNE